jgi:hypothetical protein
MALILIDSPRDADVDQLLGSMEADLRYLLQSNQIPDVIIAKIAEVGYTTTDVFANIRDTAAELRTFVKEDPSVGPAPGALQQPSSRVGMQRESAL